jgi:hypothetical protein
MKKVVSTIALGILISFGALAQNKVFTPSGDTRQNFKFGFRAGINLANVYNEKTEDFVADNKIGFVGGAFLSIPIGKFIGFQPEVLYSQKGYKATVPTNAGSFEYERTSTYLDIPLQLQIKPINGITVLVGPQYSYLLETRKRINGNVSITPAEDISTNNLRKNIFGFVVGADFNVNMLVLGIRGGWDITQSDRDGNSTNPKYKNQVLQFTLGYAF